MTEPAPDFVVRTPTRAFTWWWRRKKQARALHHTQWIGEGSYPFRTRELVRQGWRARTYSRYIDDIARTVSRDMMNGAYPATFHGGQYSTVVGPMFERYDDYRTATVRVLDAWADLPFDQATGWLTEFTVHHWVDTGGRPWWRSDELLSLPRAWVSLADLPVGQPILAWDAGLTPAEARTLHATTGLDTEALRALAALR